MVRTGFHVACVQDADCYRACGRHPLHGGHYVCQHHFVYYDVGVTSDDAIVLRNSSAASGDTYDVQPGQGVCVDHRSDLNQICPIEPLGRAMDGIVGCVSAHPQPYAHLHSL